MINGLHRRYGGVRLVSGVALAITLGMFTHVEAQGRGGGRGGRGGPGGAAATPKAAAPIDFTGQWVSVVTEDYRFRMVTPPRGDYSSVPLNAEGLRLADSWNLVADRTSGSQCKAFGAAALLRNPTRLRISWQDDNTLKLETDAGTQTRLFRFGAMQVAATPSFTDPTAGLTANTAPTAQPSGAASLQGTSLASWEAPRPGAGTLKVVTTNLLPGYLRKNGVPYSQRTTVTEYFDRHTTFGAEWVTVTTIVEDPQYLTQPFVTSSSFKKETAAEKWRPSGCDYD